MRIEGTAVIMTIPLVPVPEMETQIAPEAQKFEHVHRVVGVRVRQEREGTYLLYQPSTDELHLVDSRGKAVFDLCDGRGIDEVVVEGSRILLEGAETASDAAEAEILSFLRKLQVRGLIAWI